MMAYFVPKSLHKSHLYTFPRYKYFPFLGIYCRWNIISGKVERFQWFMGNAYSYMISK